MCQRRTAGVYDLEKWTLFVLLLSVFEQLDIDAVRRQTVEYKLKEKEERMALFFRLVLVSLFVTGGLNFCWQLLMQIWMESHGQKCCVCVDSK